MPDALTLITLSGPALARGQQQAQRRPDLVSRVRSAVFGRLASCAALLQTVPATRYLQQQREFLYAHDRAGFDESLGIASGYGLAHDDLLAYLHANILSDMAQASGPERDGCTAWAHAAQAGCLVVKNRDYRGEHGVLQQVFLHRDTDAPARTLLCLGSLGSPGSFSSGINSDGLAVVDTQIGTRDHGVGWLRYFLMTALLRDCADVDAALAMVAAVPHAGGGTLVLGDSRGAMACVELGHRSAPVVLRSAKAVARTNHCLDPLLAAQSTGPRDDLSDSSAGRLAQVQQFLDRQGPTVSVTAAQTLMGSHQAGASLCRHAGASSQTLARTLSCVVYETHSRTLHVSNGNPCDARWARFSLPDLTETVAPVPLP